MTRSLDITILGLSLSSSWGNGHATTFRALCRGLKARGHRVTFLERDVPWYASNRDLPNPGFCELRLYDSPAQLRNELSPLVRGADVVVVGSYVPDGVEVGRCVTETAEGLTAFYDIDTPVTLAKLGRGDHEYLTPELIPAYDLYLSFTGGPTLQRLEREFGSPTARALFCAVDDEAYFPEPAKPRFDLGYLGTYSDDRQPTLERLLLDPARRWPEGRFAVAGPQYPDDVAWPPNVTRYEHLPPAEHREFYNAQRFTLNVTRADMIRTGHAPSVRLFEAAACGVPIVSDWWEGLDELFEPDREILVGESSDRVLEWLTTMPDERRREIGAAGRARVLADHTALRRAEQFEDFVHEATRRRRERSTAIGAR